MEDFVVRVINCYGQDGGPVEFQGVLEHHLRYRLCDMMREREIEGVDSCLDRHSVCSEIIWKICINYNYYFLIIIRKNR